MDKFFALSEDKQATIINAALQCFGKFGYGKASINDIAVAAGISKASVFQYLGSKKGLYKHLLTYAGKIIMESFQKDDFNEKTDLFNRVLSSSFTEARTLELNPVLVKHFCNTLFEKFTTCSVLQMVSSSCCTNAV